MLFVFTKIRMLGRFELLGFSLIHRVSPFSGNFLLFEGDKFQDGCCLSPGVRGFATGRWRTSSLHSPQLSMTVWPSARKQMPPTLLVGFPNTWWLPAIRFLSGLAFLVFSGKDDFEDRPVKIKLERVPSMYTKVKVT